MMGGPPSREELDEWARYHEIEKFLTVVAKFVRIYEISANGNVMINGQFVRWKASDFDGQ